MDLSISEDREKFDEESDFEAGLAVARPKQRQISKRSKSPIRIFCRFFFFSVGKQNVQNRRKCILAKFDADPSHV